MPYEDFKKPWKVIKSQGSSCKVGAKVRIEGPENDVMVYCDEHLYGPAQYQPQKDALPEMIAKDKEYVIYFLSREEPHQIRADFTGIIAGSWTAEDNTGDEDEG